VIYDGREFEGVFAVIGWSHVGLVCGWDSIVVNILCGCGAGVRNGVIEGLVGA